MMVKADALRLTAFSAAAIPNLTTGHEQTQSPG
jgi:hypothetical protein